LSKRGQNEGSIRQRKDGTWEARFSIGKDADGKQKQKSVYGKTRKEVSEKLSKYLNEINSGTFIEPTNLTLKDWLTTWLTEYKKNSIKPTSYARYEVCANTHIIPILGNMKLKDLRPDIIQKFINDKLSNGYMKKDKNKSDKKLSARSVQYIYITLHSALSQAVKNNLVIRNIADAVNLPRKEKKEITVLDIESQNKLFEAAYNHKYGIAVHIGLMTGMRLSEVLALTWNDIDFYKGEIRVNKILQRIKTGATSKVKVQFSTKTKAGNRTIPIHDKLFSILQNHDKNDNCNYVIADMYGIPIEPKRMTNYFNEMVISANIVRITFHVLRHTFATRGLENGIDPKVMQDILGHTSITMTLDLYSHVLPNTKKAAMDKLKNIF